MADSFRLIAADDPEWSQWIEGATHDFHHTGEHHLIWQAAGSGQARLAVFGAPGRYVAWPHLVRKIDSPALAGEELFDVTDVDGYCGPVAAGCEPGDGFSRAAVGAIFGHWKRTSVVSVFTRFHPLLRNHLYFAPNANPGVCAGIPGLLHQGHTVSIDLHATEEEARRDYRSSHLHQIRRAQRNGMTVEVVGNERGFEEFVEIYYQTMERNAASRHYFFPRQYFDGLRRALGSNGSIHHARLGGRTAASVWITESCGMVQYLLGGVHEDFCSFSPLKLLLDRVREWARGRGNHSFHLGGGRGCRDNDPLFFFKTGFSRRRHCFYTGRWVLDRERYERLSAAAPGTRDAGFFPLYRAPAAQPNMEVIEV